MGRRRRRAPAAPRGRGLLGCSEGRRRRIRGRWPDNADLPAWREPIGRDGSPEAFVDWEFAGPVDRVTELAYTAWLNAQLHDDDVAELQCLPDARTRARHFHSILDGYGLSTRRRTEVVDRMIELAVHSARAEAVMAGVTPETADAVDPEGYPVLWAITWRARSASWMIRHRALLLAPYS